VVLLVYPLMLMLFPAIPAVATAGGGDLSGDRQRVLRLLEEGRINASESAQLLSALAETVPAGLQPEPLTSVHRALFVGAALVLVGFFLPWFEVNVGAELNATMRAFMSGSNARQFGVEASAMPGMVGVGGPMLTIRGGDIGHGLGWVILALCVSVPLVPYLVPTLPSSTRRSITLLAVAASAIIGLYLLTSGLTHAVYGIWVVLAGSLVQGIASIRMLRRPA
jgi:hypothetical protein